VTSPAHAAAPAAGLTLGNSAGRWTVAVTVLGSCMVFLDSTVVNVALPAIGRDFGAGVAGLQWIVNGYMLTLASLIILGGSLGDRFGRRRVFVSGVVWFTIASMLCGLAPTTGTLVAARVLQGVGGALLTPGSLAIIEASFAATDRARAIGLWSGLAGASTAFGPPLGGYLIEAVSWRAVFYLNLPIGLFVAWSAMRFVPETRGSDARRGVDWRGAALAALGLGGISFALIEAAELGTRSAAVVGAMAVGVAAAVAFVFAERAAPDPMLPLVLFKRRVFVSANAITFLVYAALGGVFFFLVVVLQTACGYSPLEAGMAGLPVTIVLLLLSERAGALSHRIGPRLPLTVGPLVAAAGMLMLRGVGPGSTYLHDVLPAVLVFSAGLVLIVAPVTATALGAAPSTQAGVASAVNNAVARTGQLIAVALLPVATGLSGREYADPQKMSDAFSSAMLLTAALAIAGGVTAALTLGGARPADDAQD